MGRSIATHSKSLKDFYIPWMDEMGVDADTSRGEHEFRWGDFRRSVRRMVHDVSGTFDTPYEETWEEDEVMLLTENGHAKVVLSEYTGMAAVGVVAQPDVETHWGQVVGENPDYLARHYCYETLIPALDEKLAGRFQLYDGGSYASNGSRMYHKR